jgi:hypothetical protein
MIRGANNETVSRNSKKQEKIKKSAETSPDPRFLMDPDYPNASGGLD